MYFLKSRRGYKILSRICTFEMAKNKNIHYIITGLQQESQRTKLFGICVAFNF